MISQLLLFLAVLTLLLFFLVGLEVARGSRTIEFLRHIPPLPAERAVRVSVVIPARNEERNLEEALHSVLHQDYPDLEVIAVDDRSTDATGAILDRMAAQHPRLRVLHVAELPTGWLGKNHALFRGAGAATGEILLFTDADVVMESSVVGRAVNYLLGRRVDHLTITPQFEMPGPLLNLFVGVFALYFAMYARPWKARDPRSARHVGIGAFNLLRAPVYRALGGHQVIAMRPDDDMKLGKLVKKHGFRQDALFGRGLLSVEWYVSLGEAVRGLSKNAFAGVDYSVATVVASSAALLLLNVWPFAALLLTGGTTWLLNAVVVLLILLLHADHARYSGARAELGIGFPLATLLFLYILWRSMLSTLARGGITWRGTHYPLEQLRANRI